MKEGWAWPGLARKAHYFREARSLCGKWMFTGVFVRNQDSSQGPDDCATCFRKREKEKAKA